MSDEFLLQRIGGYSLCGHTLGKGAFARVELGIHRLTNNQVALKIINLNHVNETYVRKNILRESAILKNLRHDNIVRLYETLAYKNSYCFVMEYLEGGDLQTYIREQKQKRLTEKQARKIFTQLMIALQYLHRNGIIHRDLKLQNIMLTENKSKVKLVDFGLSNFFDKDNLLKTQCGSAEYAAPELFDKGVHYGPSVEIWSLGVILFSMSTGKMPFEAQPSETKENLVVQIRRGLNISHHDMLKKLSQNLRGLLILTLEPDMGKRIILKDMFSHPWVTEDGKKPVIKKPPEIIPHELRQKVIDQVAQLYSVPVGKTMEHIRMNNEHSMVATYKILMDKARHNMAVKVRTHSAPSKYFKNIGIINKRCESGRPKSARPERRCKSTQDNKRDSKFHSAETSGDTKPSDRKPIASCLKINGKVASGEKPALCFHHNPTTRTSTNCSDYWDDDIKQTPFRLSPPPNVVRHSINTEQSSKSNRPRNDDDVRDDECSASNSRLVKSTIEGEFDLSTKSSGKDNKATRKIDITSDKVKVSFRGENLEKGSFKITEWRQHKVRTRVKVHHPDKKDVTSKIQSNRRCVSPSDARRMVHRSIFPLGKKSMQIKNLQSTSHHVIEPRDRTSDSFSFSSSQKEFFEEENAKHYEATKLQNEIISAIQNTTDMYMRHSKKKPRPPVNFHRHSSTRPTKPKEKTIIHKSTTSRNLNSIQRNDQDYTLDGNRVGNEVNGQRLCTSAPGSYRYDTVDTTKKKGVFRKVSFDM